jgi:hypothetical protein
MRTCPARLFALLTVLSAAACSAPAEDAVSTGNEQNLTERKIVTQETFVAGDYAEYQSDAKDALTKACTAAAAHAKAIAGARLLDAKCGEGQNVLAGSSGYKMGATMTARFVVEIEQGATPVEAPTTTAFGAWAEYQSDAANLWSKACDAELDRAKTLFGDRLIGGGCSAPKNIMSGSGYVIASPFKAFVMPAKGETATITGAIQGAWKEYMSDAFGEWTKACAAWGKSVAPMTSGHAVKVDCGEPKALGGGSGYIFQSIASIEVGSDGAAAPTTSAGAFNIGAYKEYSSDANDAWSTSCADTLALASELLGERLLGGTCAAPKNLMSGGSGYAMAGAAPIAVLSAGATKITIEGFVLADWKEYRSDAIASAAKAATDDLRSSVARTGASRVEGFEIAEPTSIANGSGYLLGSKTKLLVGVDVPEGGIAPMSDVSKVSGERAEYLSDAAVNWKKACAAAADKAKADYGDRFLGAACGAPTYANNVFTSDLTSWILP